MCYVLVCVWAVNGVKKAFFIIVDIYSDPPAVFSIVEEAAGHERPISPQLLRSVVT